MNRNEKITLEHQRWPSLPPCPSQWTHEWQIFQSNVPSWWWQQQEPRWGSCAGLQLQGASLKAKLKSGFKKVEPFCFPSILTIERQKAFGLKSVPRATITPASIIFLAGGDFSLKIYAVVGRMTATVPDSAIAEIPSSETSSKWEMALALNSLAPI